MSALTTHTFGNHREKEQEKKQIKRNFNKRSKAEKGKEQDHLKKTGLEPFRQGQRIDTSETKPCSSKEHKPPKHTRAPPAICNLPLSKCQPWAQTGQTGFQNRSDWFHTVDHTLDSWNRFQGCNTTFLHLPFSPLLPMHESRLKFEKNAT
jgi:hypothetical protein